MGETFKFGDIIENGYASIDNPTRIGVFIRYASIPRGQINAGRYLECRSANGKFWKTDVGNDKLQKHGSIFGDKDARLSALEATPSAPKVTDLEAALVVIQEKYDLRRSTLLSALTEAQEAGKP